MRGKGNKERGTDRQEQAEGKRQMGFNREKRGRERDRWEQTKGNRRGEETERTKGGEETEGKR